MKVALGVIAGLLTFGLLAGGIALTASARLYRPARAYFLDAELFSADAGWRPAGKLSASRDGHHAVSLGGGAVLVTGGNGRDERATVWSGSQWRDEAMPRVPYELGALLSVGGEAVALGGWDGDPALPLNTVARRSADGQWEQGVCPLEKIVAAGALANGRVVTIDGEGNTAAEVRDGWARLGRAGPGVGGIYGDTLLLGDGRLLLLNRYAYAESSIAQLLDVADGGWVEVPELRPALLAPTSGADLFAALPLPGDAVAIVTSSAGCPTWSPAAHTVTAHPCPFESMSDALYADVGGGTWLALAGEAALRWNPSTGATAPAPLPEALRTRATLTGLGDGRALLVGGGALDDAISVVGVASGVGGVLGVLVTLALAIVVWRRPGFTRGARIGFFVGFGLAGCGGGALVFATMVAASAIRG